MWLRGFFGSDAHRPDRLGLIFATIKDKRLGKILACWESRPLAAQSEKGAYILENLSRQYYIYFFPYGDAAKRVVMGPDLGKLQELAEAT